jgi:RNA polymerase sigma factor (sigma-70 family)
MAARPAPLLDYLHRLASQHGSDPAPDAVLLDLFRRGQDEAAFAALVARHGPMVFRLCRRMLGDAQAAEDAFQATFLVLARRAAAVRPPEVLAAWLHQVAYRVALKMRGAGVRRRARETSAPDLAPADPHPDPLAELSARELLTILDEEMQRLPDVYRLPLIHCCLEGRTQEETASLLGWTPGSVKGRLERGRARLHARLARRGLALTAALAAAEVARCAARAAVSPALAASIAQAGLWFAAGRGAAFSRAATFAEATLQTMAWRKATALAGFLAAVIGVAGAGTLAHQVLADRPSGAQDQAVPPQASPAEPGRRADADGDALPERAIARLGTLRFRGVRGCLAFAPDGKLLAAATGPAGERVTLWDAATGREVRQIDGSATLTELTFSPDGKRLACCTSSGRCRVLDLAGGQELLTTPGSLAAFSGDGKVLVTGDTAGNAGVRVWDAATGKPLPVEASGPIGDLALASDGRTAAVIEQADHAVVRIRDLVKGTTVGSIRTAGPDAPHSLSLAPDGKTLATATDTAVRLWDVATGKEVRSWGRRGDSRPVFAPDGKHLAWTGYDERMGIARLWVVARNDAEPRAVGEPVNRFELPCFSPDRKVLAVVTDAQAVQLREVANGKEVVRLDAHDSPVNGVAFTADGRHVVSRSRTGTFAWEALTGRLLRRSPGAETATERVEALLPDGRLLTADPTTDPRHGLFRVRDALTGQEALRFEGRPDVGPPCAVVAPGGRFAALRGRAGEVCVIELNADRCSYRLDPKVAASGLKLSADGDVLVWYARTFGGIEIHVHRHSAGKTLVLGPLPANNELNRWLTNRAYASPDGRWLVVPTREGTLRRWDLMTGKELSPLAEAQRTVWDLCWSPDGRVVAARGWEAEPEVIDEQARRDLRVWDMTTGKRLTHLDLPVLQSRDIPPCLRFPPDIPACTLFSADGRTLLTTDLRGAIGLREVATGQERGLLRGHLPGAIEALAVSADGRMLASGGYDSQVLVWDLTGRMPDGNWRTVRLPAERLRAAWDALAGADARAAYAAGWELAADPEGTTAFLRERLRPVARPDPERLARLIGDLDADDFTVRQRAGGDLEALGEVVAADLRQALARKPSAEARRRLEGLLEGLDHPPVRQRLQALRAVEVLEEVGNPQARQVLESLAKGMPEARLTQEAKASLERLAERPAAVP